MSNGKIVPLDLSLFHEAREKIEGIFKNAEDVISRCSDFMINSLDVVQNFKDVNVDIDQWEENGNSIRLYKERFQEITKVLMRNRMKVVFFGRTSNGKSSTINAMLETKILPSGIGHTTHCFISIEGTDSDEPYMLECGSNIKKNIKSISELTSALSDTKVNSDAIVNLYIPKDNSRILQNDVILVDSPGIDVSIDYDACIENYCMDADVFVLVANSESTLMNSEKNFFHKVSERLSKPQIFILNNRWDASDHEMESREEVKQQHITRNCNFLVDELKSCTLKEAQSRIFFVSAREILATRMKENCDSFSNENSFIDLNESNSNYIERCDQFSQFLNSFSVCMTRSAVRTKVGPHTKSASDMLQNTINIVEERFALCMAERKKIENEYKITNEKMNTSKKLTNQYRQHFHEKIEIHTQKMESILDELYHKLNHELTYIVSDFSKPFRSDPDILEAYKSDLVLYLYDKIFTFLKDNFNSDFSQLSNIREDLIDKFTCLNLNFPVQNVPPSLNLDKYFLFNINDFCLDFHPDICFKFSLSPANIVKWIFKTNNNESSSLIQPITQVGISTVVQTAKGLATSKSTIAIVTLAALAARSSGFKFVGGILGIYGIFYGLEYLMWTNKAKKRLFNKQFVSHLTKKISYAAEPTKTIISSHVKHDLDHSLKWCVSESLESIEKLQSSSQSLNHKIHHLEEIDKKSVTYTSQAKKAIEEIVQFKQKYLDSIDQ